MEGLKLDNNRFALFMFMSLSQQAEAWSYVLKDKVNFRTKQLLSTYLSSAKSLYTHMAGNMDMDDLLDDSQVWSDLLIMLLELPIHKKQALYMAMKEFLNGNITIEDDTDEKIAE
jgi:hypothetical protein